MRWMIMLVMCGCVSDTTPPEILEVTPGPGASLVGAGKVIANALVSDDSGIVNVDLFDGDELIGSYRESDCKDVCAFAINWDTKLTPAGRHELRLVATDDSDNVDATVHAVTIDDLVKATSLEVTNLTDESGTLEMEVYAFDTQTHALLGCAGGRDGLSPVDASNIRYTVDATILLPNDFPLGALEFAERPVTFEVWEDDDSPVCPSVPSATGNTMVGASPPMTSSALATRQQLAFGSVTNLTLELARPLTLSDTLVPPKRPPPIDEDPNDDWGGGGGCNAGRGDAGFVLVLLLVVARRRSAR